MSPAVQSLRQPNVVSHSVPVSQAVCSAQQLVWRQSLHAGMLKSCPAARLSPPPAPVVFEPVVSEPVVVIDPVVVIEPVVFEPVPPLPPLLSPVVVPVVPLSPHPA